MQPLSLPRPRAPGGLRVRAHVGVPRAAAVLTATVRWRCSTCPSWSAVSLKAGYTIIGTEFSAEMGLLVKMAKQLDARRDAVFLARAGVLEGAARFFGTAAGN